MVLVPENAGGLRPARATALWDAGGSGRGECSPCLSSLEESNYVSIDFKARNSNSPANTRSQTLSPLSPGRNLFTSGLNEHLAPILPPPPPPFPSGAEPGGGGAGALPSFNHPIPTGVAGRPWGGRAVPPPLAAGREPRAGCHSAFCPAARRQRAARGRQSLGAGGERIGEAGGLRCGRAATGREAGGTKHTRVCTTCAHKVAQTHVQMEARSCAHARGWALISARIYAVRACMHLSTHKDARTDVHGLEGSPRVHAGGFDGAAPTQNHVLLRSLSSNRPRLQCSFAPRRGDWGTMTRTLGLPPPAPFRICSVAFTPIRPTFPREESWGN